MVWKGLIAIFALLSAAWPASLASDAVVPPFKVLPEAGDPDSPSNLTAEATEDGWLVAWNAVATPAGMSISYQVHAWVPASGWSSHDAEATQMPMEAMATGGIITVTAMASSEGGDMRTSAAEQFLVFTPDGVAACPPVLIWIPPPPPGIVVDPQCIG